MKRHYQLKTVSISGRSKFILWIMRWLVRPVIRIAALFPRSMAFTAQLLSSPATRETSYGLAVGYRVFGRSLGHTLGDWDALSTPEACSKQRLLLYIHGGAFIMPALPGAHIAFVARLCADLDAVGMMPDYRLAPLHPFPKGLDDCEMAYAAILEMGFKPENIVLAGESAGGNLTLGLLQRIRKAGLPMPCCAVPISAVTEVARVQAPPSRRDRAFRDPMLPIGGFSRMLMDYAADADGSDPELSPILADFSHFPPLYFIVGEDEILLDDTLIAEYQARQHGVQTQLDVWPRLPHAFPLMAGLFPEARLARRDVVSFVQQWLVAAED